MRICACTCVCLRSELLDSQYISNRCWISEERFIFPKRRNGSQIFSLTRDKQDFVPSTFSRQNGRDGTNLAYDRARARFYCDVIDLQCYGKRNSREGTTQRNRYRQVGDP